MMKCVIHTTNMKDWLARFGHILGSFAIECSICAQKKKHYKHDLDPIQLA
jgi:hypothetical protein